MGDRGISSSSDANELHANGPKVIVLGNQKSGTSVIAHLLADFGGLSKTVDIPPLWGKKGARIMSRQRTLASVVESHPEYFSKELIKEPMMTFFPDEVFNLFPGARYVYVIRDPRDNIRSFLNRRKIPGDRHQLSFKHKLLLFRRITVDAKVWGGEDENYIGVLAHRWNLAMDRFEHCRDRCELVKYEDFMSDKLGFIEGLADRLNIERKNDISDRLDHAYQPPGNHSQNWVAFFGKKNLERIERICLEGMIRHGYADPHQA